MSCEEGLCAQCNSYGMLHETAELADLRAQLKAAVEKIELLTWAENSGYPICRLCRRWQHLGHAEGCPAAEREEE